MRLSNGQHKRLEFSRRNMAKGRQRVIPSSMALLHGWRANCDVKILLYESDPENPDSKDIATVTNYLVSYASKGQETIAQEKESMRTLILAAQEVTGCQRELFSLARRLLNR